MRHHRREHPCLAPAQRLGPGPARRADGLDRLTLIDALAGFFDQYIFGHDRAALLAAQLPATTAGHAEQQARKITRLQTQLARIDAAERGLISELEAPADPGDPAAAAYRARIRARYAELYTERTRTETELAALQATTTPANDPTLLDELPFAAGVPPCAPPAITAADIATGSSSRARPRSRMRPRRPSGRGTPGASRARTNAMHPIVSSSTIAKSMTASPFPYPVLVPY